MNPSLPTRHDHNDPTMTTTTAPTPNPSSTPSHNSTSASTVVTTSANPTSVSHVPIQVLPLRLSHPPRVTWQEGTVDNEHLGRKSSKRCCIYHKPRKFGESSSDESESSDDNDDDGGDIGNECPSGNNERGSKKMVRTKLQRVPDFQRFHA